MSGSSSQKKKTLAILKILHDKTDELHPLSTNAIIEALASYGIQAERKSVYADIAVLQSFGYDIVCDKSSANHYYIGSRDFELAELKMLVDAVQASKFMTLKKSQNLINKIEKLASVHQAKALQRDVTVFRRVKSVNERIYYSIDAIHEAIQSNKTIRFKYYTYDVLKNFVPRRGGEWYLVSPYALVWADENYYLIAYHERYGEMSHFRVDRINNAEIMDERKPLISTYKDFDVVAYTNKIFGMFGGETETVVIAFDNDMVNVVIDKFGNDVFIHSKTETQFKVTVEIATTSTFYSWLALFGNKAQVIAPERVVASVKAYFLQMVEQY